MVARTWPTRSPTVMNSAPLALGHDWDFHVEMRFQCKNGMHHIERGDAEVPGSRPRAANGHARSRSRAPRSPVFRRSAGRRLRCSAQGSRFSAWSDPLALCWHRSQIWTPVALGKGSSVDCQVGSRGLASAALPPVARPQPGRSSRIALPQPPLGSVGFRAYALGLIPVDGAVPAVPRPVVVPAAASGPAAGSTSSSRRRACNLPARTAPGRWSGRNSSMPSATRSCPMSGSAAATEWSVS